MPKKKPPDPTQKPQRERFIDAAKDVGADESGRAFDKAMLKISPPKLGKR